jgi:hypothetical protein
MMYNENSPPRCRLSWHELAAAAFAIAILTVTTVAVHAEVRVNGNATALRIDASQSQVAEILSALGPTFHVRVTASIALDKHINGRYTGSLGQLLSRVLDGYNYVIKRQGTAIEVVVIGTRGDRAVAVEPLKPAPTKSLAAEWRTSTVPTPQAPQQ